MVSYLNVQNTYNGEIDNFVSRRYRVVARLSKGGTSEIFMAVDISNNSKVVIKILPPHDSTGRTKGKVENSRGNTLDISHRVIEKSAEFMIQEANFLKNCRHPNIVRLLDYDLEAQRPYIVLNYLGNITLEKEILNSALNFSLKKTLGVLQQICAALNYIHKKGFVYCDIKPSNVILRQKKYTLIDFGLVRPIGMEVSGGTIGYMAPEIIQHQGSRAIASPTMDIYSLGILLYELLTGFHPLANQKIYDAQNHYYFDIQTVTDEYAIPQSANHLNPFLPSTFNKILLKCINKNAEGRYQTMDALLKDFEKEAGKFI